VVDEPAFGGAGAGLMARAILLVLLFLLSWILERLTGADGGPPVVTR
jgi:hypothetical protein